VPRYDLEPVELFRVVWMTIDRESTKPTTEWLVEYDGSGVTADIAVARALEAVGFPADRWRLRDVLDPESLDRLFRDSEPSTRGTVSFVVDAYRVVVYASGFVRVARADPASSGVR
jgi:hypothetical protein